ncbi:MAG: hypothetical protein VKJ64_04830 [Leptolyngbyaceae bacterium]|nr:hypothetical protein [Leptolyngbyaceae bacterium]
MRSALFRPLAPLHRWFLQQPRCKASVLLILLVAIMVRVISYTPTAQATPLCRQWGVHRICIVDIQRSAKNYWEYRAVVTIDDQRQPKAVYNCRDRTRTIPQTGQTAPFEPAGVGTLICQILHR